LLGFGFWIFEFQLDDFWTAIRYLFSQLNCIQIWIYGLLFKNFPKRKAGHAHVQQSAVPFSRTRAMQWYLSLRHEQWSAVPFSQTLSIFSGQRYLSLRHEQLE
jgi:hypothetical protein